MFVALFCGLMGLVTVVIAEWRGLAKDGDRFGWWLFGALLFPVALPTAIFKRK